MAELVAGWVTSAVVKIASDKLSSAVAEQTNLLCNFRSDRKDMLEMLKSIAAVLEDAERQSVTKQAVRLWLKRLKHAALDISDMMDIYQGKKAGMLSSLQKKLVLANKMKEMREVLRKINDQYRSFNLSTSNDDNHNHNPSGTPETAASDVYKAHIIDREGEKEAVISMLSSVAHKAETVIVPIYGLGGMGKSTLAGLVFNDAEFNKKYDHRVWIHVSQVFDLLQIGNCIISGLLRSQWKANNLESVHNWLDDYLPGKKILIVLDDIWEEGVDKLERLKAMLRVRSVDSVIDVIVTTRKEDIAKKISNNEPYKIPPLTAEMCWDIIKRASQWERRANKRELEKIGMNIAEKCQGLALAAQALGYTLRFKGQRGEWSAVENSAIWSGSSKDNEVLPSLKLSFESIPSYMKLCFSYCAIFPKGYNIIEHDLIRQWIALGFIGGPSEGKECIKHLFGMSFLDHLKLPLASRKQTVYTMHDLVHDLARAVMDDELIVIDTATTTKTTDDPQYCRYALLGDYCESSKLCPLPKKVRAVHFLKSNNLGVYSGQFSFAKCLRVLDFSECATTELPASISELKQLRYLIAPNVKDGRLPVCLTKLSRLQYLNLKGSSQIPALPKSLGKLECLVHLDLSDCSGISELPESFGDLECLSHLDLSGCSGIVSLSESFGNLKNLSHLDLSGCSGIGGLPESVGQLKRLLHLKVSDCSGIIELPETFGDLECLSHLDLSGCSGIVKLPESFRKLINLSHLALSGCSGITELPEKIGTLESLSLLDLSGCSGIVKLSESFGELKNLSHLKVSDCSGIIELPETFGDLECLSHLNLSGCSGIVSLPGSFGKLKNLLHLDLSGCKGIKRLPDALCGITKLQHLNLSHCSRLDELPDDVGNLVDLRYLNLSDCRNFTSMSVPDSFSNLRNLVHLDFSYCPELTSTNRANMGYKYLYSISAFTNLEHLILKNNGVGYIPESFGNLKKLRTLDLSGCSSLVSIPESLSAIRLKSLVVDGCDDYLIRSICYVFNNYLLTLPVFVVSLNGSKTCSNLHLLEGVNLPELEIIYLDVAMSPEEARSVKLSEKEKLSKLRLSWDLQTWYEARPFEDKELLEELVPPMGLKDLSLHAYRSKLFPSWLLRVSHYLPKLVCIRLSYLPECTDLPPIGQLPNLEELHLQYLPRIKKIDGSICGGTGAFRRLSTLTLVNMNELEQWNTAYCCEDGQMEFMFPMLDKLSIKDCPRLRLKPRPPIFRVCEIESSHQVLSLLDDATEISHPCSTPCTKLMVSSIEYCGTWTLLHHIAALQELEISQCDITSLPESMRSLASLRLLKLYRCNNLSVLPEWLGDLKSLASLTISNCKAVESLPPSIQQLTELQKLHINGETNTSLVSWCESEENEGLFTRIKDCKVDLFMGRRRKLLLEVKIDPITLVGTLCRHDVANRWGVNPY